MTCRMPKTHHTSCPTPTDIVTYRYNSELVYVPAATDYIQALSHARDAFPQLKELRDTSISLSVTAPGQARQCVGISAPAWPKLVAHLSRYQIIDVHVTTPPARDVAPAPGAMSIPAITITYADADDVVDTEPAPPYPAPTSRGGSEPDSVPVDDEKAPRSYQTRPRLPARPQSPSQSSLHSWKRNWFFQKFHGSVFNAS